MIRPRVLHVPEFTKGSGEEALDVVAKAGLALDDWQSYVLERSLGENPDGSWASFEVGVCCPRQNGKSEIAVARMIAGLLLFREPLQVFSSHLFDTSREIFIRLAGVLEDHPTLGGRFRDPRDQGAKISRGRGSEAVELDGRRIRFRARGAGGGRGFSPSCVLYDEAMFLSSEVFADMVPSVSAQPEQQIWLLGSTPDRSIHADSVTFARMRERALGGDGGALSFFEWSIGLDQHEVTAEIAADPATIEAANPAIAAGRLTLQKIAPERDALDLPTYARERLGAGPWPSTDGSTGVIPEHCWLACADDESEPFSEVCLGVDVALDRESVAIAVAGLREDELPHLELIEVWPAVRGAAERIAQIVGLIKPRPFDVVLEGRQSAGLALALEDLHIGVTAVNASEYADAAALFYDFVLAQSLRYRRTEAMLPLDAAVRVATKKTRDAGFTWSRQGSTASIAPLVAASLAVWKAVNDGQRQNYPLCELIGSEPPAVDPHWGTTWRGVRHN
jgi:hypothetical protein